jgi:hypothetical protein
MRKSLLIIALITISCFESYSQIIFENGYFIDESNNKIECLIKNIDWNRNPTAFEYKISPNEAVQKASIQTVKEFGINNVCRYIRAKTNIDRSSEQLYNMSSERNPDFQEELLFLKVLIEGKASLFLFNDENLIRFFYKVDDSEINQLVYKSYIVNDSVFKNTYFKTQLFIQLKCEGIQINDIERVGYWKEDLEKLFIKYNECNNFSYINYEPKQKKDLFHLSIRPGINYGSLKIQHYPADYRAADFGGNIGIRFGIETEFVLPFNKNKWAIIAEPTYQYYKTELQAETSRVYGGILVTRVDYKSIELPIGMRHYFYLNDKSKLFINISFVYDFEINSSIEFIRKDNTLISELEIKTRVNTAFGIGYKYKNRYSIETRYNTNREILSDYQDWQSGYKSLNVYFGISVF